MEMFELSTPHFMEYYEYLPDSAGAGEWRGGLGTTLELALLRRGRARRHDRRRRRVRGRRPRAPGSSAASRPASTSFELHFPDGTMRGLGLEGDRARHSRRARSAWRGTAAAPATAIRSARDPLTVLAEVRDGLRLAREGARELRRRRARRPARASTRPRRRGCARSARMSYRVGIDVGGTFTDFLVIGARRRRGSSTRRARRPPTRRSAVVDRARGDRSAELGIDARRVPRRHRGDRARHDGDDQRRAHPARRARPACSRRKGFRDALALRNGLREEPYDNRLQPPDAARPALPARSASSGRIDYAGDEVDAARRATTSRAACERFRGEGVEAVAISFMHSPANPAHERRARDLCRELLPERLRDGVERPAAAGALLRPHLDDGAERLRRADHHALPRAR